MECCPRVRGDQLQLVHHKLKMTKLSPAERFRKTLAHEQPDRPPIWIKLVREMNQALQDHFEKRFGSLDLHNILEVDFRSVGPRLKKEVLAQLNPQSSSKSRMPDGIRM